MASADLGIRIKRARERKFVNGKPMSQMQLAKMVGAGVRSVGRWERGEAVPRSHIGPLEAVLGINLSDGQDDRDDWYDENDPIERGIAETLPAPDARKFIAQLRAARMEHVPRAHEPPAS